MNCGLRRALVPRTGYHHIYIYIQLESGSVKNRSNWAMENYVADCQTTCLPTYLSPREGILIAILCSSQRAPKTFTISFAWSSTTFTFGRYVLYIQQFTPCIFPLSAPRANTAPSHSANANSDVVESKVLPAVRRLCTKRHITWQAWLRASLFRCERNETMGVQTRSSIRSERFQRQDRDKYRTTMCVQHV